MASIPPFSPEPHHPTPYHPHTESPEAATSVELRPESVSAHFSLFKKALTLYQTIELPERPVVFSTSVFSDGWGDLFSCLNAVKLFRAQHPNAPYRILIYNRNPNPMPPIAYEQFLVDPTYVASANRLYKGR